MTKPSAIKKAMNKVVGKNTTPPAVFKIPKKKKSRSIPMPEPVYFPPTLTITDEDCPVVKNWKAGQTLTLTIKAKVIEHNNVVESDWRPAGTEAKLRIMEIAEGGGK